MRGARTHGLTEEVSRFQGDLRQLAMQIVETVLRRELEARQYELAQRAQQQARAAKRKPAAPPSRAEVKRAKGKAPKAAKPAKTSKASKRRDDGQLELELAVAAAAAAAAAAAPVEVASSPPAAPSDSTPDARLAGKRRKWTRDSIVEELAHWLVKGNSVDASFVTRHGPPGLAAAARRVFGRFDAALNVAGLHVAKLYPDGPPPKNVNARAAAAAPSATAN
jgi:hypothetical protein